MGMFKGMTSQEDRFFGRSRSPEGARRETEMRRFRAKERQGSRSDEEDRGGESELGEEEEYKSAESVGHGRGV